MAKESFEWDSEKDLVNQAKHGVSFVEAQYAFADPARVIAEDLSHSENEERYYCFGKVGNGVIADMIEKGGLPGLIEVITTNGDNWSDCVAQ